MCLFNSLYCYTARFNRNVEENDFLKNAFVLLFFWLFPLQGGCWSLSQLHVGEGRIHPWTRPQLITMPYKCNQEFDTLLKGTSALL